MKPHEGAGDANFGVGEERVRDILGQVHRDQTFWMLVIGTLMLAAPAYRYGRTYQFVLGIPCGDDIFGAIYLTLGIVMLLAIKRDHQKAMCRALFCAAMLNWTLGIFLLLGAIAGPTGVLGAPFALYVGRHMFVQSVLLSDRRGYTLRTFHEKS